MDLESGRVLFGEGPDLSGVDPEDLEALAAAAAVVLPDPVDGPAGPEPGGTPAVDEGEGVEVVGPVADNVVLLRPPDRSWKFQRGRRR